MTLMMCSLGMHTCLWACVMCASTGVPAVSHGRGVTPMATPARPPGTRWPTSHRQVCSDGSPSRSTTAKSVSGFPASRLPSARASTAPTLIAGTVLFRHLPKMGCRGAPRAP